LINDARSLADQTRQSISLIQSERLSRDFTRFMEKFDLLCSIAERKQREQPLNPALVELEQGDPLDPAWWEESEKQAEARRAQQRLLDVLSRHARLILRTIGPSRTP
jgi:hypothetical protein